MYASVPIPRDGPGENAAFLLRATPMHAGSTSPIVFATAESRRARRVHRLVLLAMVLTAALAFMPAPAAAQSVGLGTAGNFGVLGGAEVTNTGPTVVNGSVGVWAGTSITGFPPGS